MRARTHRSVSTEKSPTSVGMDPDIVVQKKPQKKLLHEREGRPDAFATHDAGSGVGACHALLIAVPSGQAAAARATADDAARLAGAATCAHRSTHVAGVLTQSV